MRLELLVDSVEFWSRLRADLSLAHDRVYVQALTFEGDATGLGLARALLEARAPDRRVAVDNYTKYDQADKFLFYPPHLFDRALWQLVLGTRRMFRELEAGGVQVLFTNPVGFLFRRFPARNHKKLVLVDDRIAYLGGINFADLNFHWRDMMLRIEDPEIVEVLREDFLATWGGRNHSATWSFPGLELHVLDGQSNPEHFAHVLARIESARESIYVECPSLTQPFVGRLVAAQRRGVPVTAVTPSKNNWEVIEAYMSWLASATDLEVRFYQGRLTHLKAMLVDGRCLIMGSANFDPWSYWFQQEYLAVVTAPEIVDDFRRRVMAEGLHGSVAAASGRVGPRERLAGLHLRALEALTLLLNGRSPHLASTG